MVAFDRLKGIARRVKRRVAGDSAVGDGFGPAQDTVFARLDDNADASFQLIGASVVGTWEVLLTDVSRAVNGAVPEAEGRKLLDRISDALVPTQEPMQSASRIYRKALKQGVQQALSTGRLADATAPVVASLALLPDKMGQGWVSTAEYLEPVLSVLSPDGALLVDFQGRGGELAAELSAHNATYADRMAAMPQATDLDAELAAALDTWRAAVSRSMELFLYARRTSMVDAAKRLPR